MRDREHRDVICQPDEHDVIGKVVHRKAPDVFIGNAGNERSRVWELLEVPECLPDLRRKALRYVGTPLAVPGGRLPKLAPCALAEPYLPHRDSTSL